MTKFCHACNGPLCPFCGGCINEGECDGCGEQVMPELEEARAIMDNLPDDHSTEDIANIIADLKHRLNAAEKKSKNLLATCMKTYEAIQKTPLWTHRGWNSWIDELEAAIAAEPEGGNDG